MKAYDQNILYVKKLSIMLQRKTVLGWEVLSMPQVGIPDLVHSPRKNLPSEEWMGNGKGEVGVGQGEEVELELVCEMKSNF